jgi:hypothetical protein
MFPGTDGVIEVDPAMHGEFAFGVHVTIEKKIDESIGGRQLLLAGASILEIAHEADADPGIVYAGFADVTASELFGPTRANFDLAVAGVASVADNEMVGETVLHAAPTVIGIVGAGIAGLNPAVVDHDVTPSVAIHFDFARGGYDRRKRGDGTSIGGNDQELTDENAVTLETVARLQGPDSGVVAVGDGGESIAFLDPVGDFSRAGCCRQDLTGAQQETGGYE